MRKRNLMLGLLGLGLAQILAHAAAADPLQMVIPTKAGVSPENATAVIKVDGKSFDGPYDQVANKTLDYIVALRGDPHKKTIGVPTFRVKLDSGAGGKDAFGAVSKSWKYYAVSGGYHDPRSHQVENVRVSPIDMCNDKLKATSGAAREDFLKKGTMFTYKDAYKLNGQVTTEIKKVIGFSEIIHHNESIDVPVVINCLPLERPRVRTQTSTKPASKPAPTAKKMEPTVSDVTLRIEPSKIVQDGKFLCPSELRLYGRVEVIRKFTGKSIFVGPHYLSAITPLSFTSEGGRNVIATYPMNWHQMGGLALQANTEPKKQTLTFRFNVSNSENKLQKSTEKTIEVSCKKIQVNVPSASDEMTVAPTN